MFIPHKLIRIYFEEWIYHVTQRFALRIRRKFFVFARMRMEHANAPMIRENIVDGIIRVPHFIMLILEKMEGISQNRLGKYDKYTIVVTESLWQDTLYRPGIHQDVFKTS